MSKSFFKIAIAVVGIVLAIPSAGFSLGLSSLAIAAIGVGLTLVSSLLLSPKAPRTSASTTDRLHISFDSVAPRRIVFGLTAMGTDVRYQAYSGTNQSTYNQIIAVAAHQVESIDEIWFDSDLAWSASGGIQTKFANYLTVSKKLVGVSGAGFAVDSVWTAAASLTGCAHMYLTYKLTGNSSSTQSPFASSIPSRVTVRGKGALVYDPRLDSTVAGGSGTQRAATQSTWSYGTDAGRNPALQLLWYLIGWRINNKVSVGRGIPPARIDLASFITAANICDELVTQAVGGTAKRYYSDGMMSENDDPTSAIQNLMIAMNGAMRDSGGKLSLVLLTNDLASPALALTEGDILGEETWQQTPQINQHFNIVRGRYVDPSNTALYQLADFPEVSLTSPDTIDRFESVDFAFVQSSSQVQRLAKTRLQRAQYQGRFSAKFGVRAWQLNLGDCVSLSHASLGWANKKFRIVAQTIAANGVASIVMSEEDPAIYAWAASETPAVTAATPIIYDPLNNPLLLGIGAAQASANTAQTTATAAQTAADTAQAAATAAQTSANTANADLANIASDSLLTPGEKPVVIKDRDAITAEQAGIDAKATTYSITTEKTAYDTAVTALTTYLATLTTPTLWTNLTGNTTIVGATFRTKFLDVYAARQTLLNAIYAAAKVLAETSTPVVNGNTAFAIAADYNGTITTALPFTRQFSALQGTTDVSPTTAFVLSAGYDALGLSVNNTANSATRGMVTVGLNQITLSTTPSTGTGTAILTATLPSGAVVTKTLAFTKTLAPRPASGGAGSTSGSLSPVAATSTSSTALGAEVIVRSDATSKIKISMDINFTGGGSSSPNTRRLYTIVAYATSSGGALTDIFASSATATNPDTYSSADAAWNGLGNTNLPLTQYTLPAANTDYYFKQKTSYNANGVTGVSGSISIQQV